MENEKFTWYDLKKFCNELSPDLLGQEVVIWGEEKAFTVKGTELLEDDFFNPSGEGLEPVFLYKNSQEQEDLDYWEEWLKDEPILCHKGDPRLLID